MPTHQKCHIHYIREIDDTIQYKSPGPQFALELKKIIYDSHDTAKIRSKSKRLLAKENLEWRIADLISEQYTEKNCIMFVKRIRREGDMLFTFLITGTDSHNNAAESYVDQLVCFDCKTDSHNNAAESYVDQLVCFDCKTDSHNNAAERAIRPNVIIRKITNGHRSESGIFSHKVLMSIKETCRMRGLNFHDYALDYLGNFTSKL